MSDKLLTLREAAELLVVSEEQLRRLVEKEVIPAYQIGGKYLRFKEEQVLKLKATHDRKAYPTPQEPHKYEDSADESIASRLGDFIYFNDFYLASAFIIALLLYIINNSIR